MDVDMAPGSNPVPFRFYEREFDASCKCNIVFCCFRTRWLAGLRRLLRRPDDNLAPRGWDQGAKWAWLVLADRKESNPDITCPIWRL